MKRFAVVIIGIMGLGGCLFALIPTLHRIEPVGNVHIEKGANFLCQVFVGQPALKIGEEQNIVVFAQERFGRGIAQVSGVVDLEFLSGLHQKTYLPPTGQDGMSSVSFSILKEYFDGETGRVIVRAELWGQNAKCEAETTFLAWY